MFSVQWSGVGLTRPVILFFAAIMAWLVARSAIHEGSWYFMLYNADSLYIPSFFDDLIRHRDHLSGWRFSPAPNFFPDMAIYGAASLTGAGFRTAVIVATFLQIALFVDACRSLAATARLRGEIAAAVVMVLMALCFAQFFYKANAFPENNDVYWLCSLVILGNHFGAVLASLWGMILIGGALEGGVRTALMRGAALVVLIVATSYSDILYLVWFSAPAIFCLLCCLSFARGGRLRIVALALAIATASILAYGLLTHFNPLLKSYRDDAAGGWQAVVKGFAFSREFLFGAGWENALHAAIFGGAVLLLAVYSAVRLVLAIIRRGGAGASSPVRPLITGILAVSPIACIAAGLYVGLFRDLGMPRYTLPLVYTTWAGIGVALAEAVGSRWSFRLPSWGRWAFLAGAVPLLCLFLGTRHYNARLPQQPELSCIPTDRALAGLGEYWRARLVDMFSDRRLQVAPLASDAVPSWWISNRYWLTHRRDQPDTMPLYSFIDMRRLDAAVIERHYGKPSRIVPCLGGDIWFYDDAEQLTHRFMELYVNTPAALDP